MITRLFIPFLLAVLVTACQEEPAPPVMDTPAVVDAAPEPDSLLRHAVFFSFKESASPEQITEVQQAFSALPDQIDGIVDYEWGTNNSPEGLNKGFTHAFFVTFEDEDARAAYLPHPAHQSFGEKLGPILDDVFVVDYWSRND
ncbi:Dabb family protein [Lewinella sp. IMCC34183]|uniref:Dabb family protein n=1 Tax=Lewinella sp. IMCC34183 TaxID=2248762 RepID=UPI000E223F97|nr:Dabb family protein [Lewinella sp. IMCC34183]